MGKAAEMLVDNLHLGLGGHSVSFIVVDRIDEAEACQQLGKLYEAEEAIRITPGKALGCLAKVVRLVVAAYSCGLSCFPSRWHPRCSDLTTRHRHW